MKARKVWDDITLLVSKSGKTLTANVGQDTDYTWEDERTLTVYSAFAGNSLRLSDHRFIHDIFSILLHGTACNLCYDMFWNAEKF